MDTLIFCPTCKRFVGDKAKCPYCNWVRPVENSRVGQIKWQTTDTVDEALPGAPPFPVQITPANGLLFVPTESGDIIAYEAETGREVWRRTLRTDRLLRTHAVATWQDVLLIGCEHLSTLPTRDRSLLAWRMSDAADAWSFPTNGDSLSAPLVHDDVAYFTSSEPRLYALDLNTQQVRWSVPAFSAAPDAPALLEHTLVVPSRGPQLAAYSSLDGERLWVVSVDDKENEWLNYPPIVTTDLVYASGWNKQNQLYAIDRTTGEVRWRFKSERGFTCPPVLAGDTLLIGVKDYRYTEENRKAGYGLCALDAATGAERWRFRTDKHLQVAPAVIDDVVLIGADDRRLRALNLADGDERWQIALPDKVRGRPLVIGDTVIVGLRNEALACVWWRADRPMPLGPQTLLDQDRPLDAAAAYAVQGQLDEAACLLERHEHWSEAAELWREADQLEEAAASFVKAGDYHQALDLYRQLNNRVAEARILIQQGKHAEAAALYEEVGDLELAVQEYRAAGRQVHAAGLLECANQHEQAAQLYAEAHEYDEAAEAFIRADRFAEAAAIYLQLDRAEAAIGVLIQGDLLIEAAQLNERLGRLHSAADLYEKAGQTDRALTLYEQIADWPHVIELAEKAGRWAPLAMALKQSGQLSRAAEVYEQAELFESALELQEILKDWDKIEALARLLKNWPKLANALKQQGLLIQAGEAYEQAAEEAEAAQATSDEVAAFYEEAALCHEAEEQWPKYHQCWQRVCALRKWPYVRGQIRLTSPFFEDEYNRIELIVVNDGSDIAHAVQIKEISPKFTLDQTETVPVIRALPPGLERTLPVSLKPKPNVRGKVLLRIVVAYEDRPIKDFTAVVEYLTEIRAHDEKLVELNRAAPGDTRPNIIVHGGNVVVDGTQVQGDQIGAGGQKGDKIEMNRDSGRRVEVSDEAVKFERPRETECKNCGLSLPADTVKCTRCGALLS